MGLVTKIENPVLKEMILKIEAQLTPQQKTKYLPIVNAGMKILFDDRTHKFVKETVRGSKELTKDAVRGTLWIIGQIANASKGTIAVEMAAPAAIVLLCYVVDFMEDMTGGRTSPDTIAKMVQTVTVETLKLFGITQEKLAQGIQYARDHQQERDDQGYYPDIQHGLTSPTQPAAPTSPAPQGV